MKQSFNRTLKYAMGIQAFLTIVLIAPVFAYDPPERIWYKEAPYWVDGYPNYFHSYTWIGDQNGDGCDELLIAQEPFQRRGRPPYPETANRVELYFGGENMSDEPDHVFFPTRQYGSIGRSIANLGNLFDDDLNCFAILTYTYLHEEGEEFGYKYIDIYSGGENLDTIPRFTIRTEKYGIRIIQSDRPVDVNGDGADDLLTFSRRHGYDNKKIDIFYGGADFEAVPDDTLINRAFGRWFMSEGVCSGFDLNGDGCDEIMTATVDHDGGTGWHLNFYLGGSPIDTIPIFDFGRDSFHHLGYILSKHGFLSDVNNDGYDDWAFGVGDTVEYLDVPQWIFFGGDSLDAEPDRELQQGGVMLYGPGFARGGDLNGDGIGDIIVKGTSEGGNGHIAGYFGSPWLDPDYFFFFLNDQYPEMGGMRHTQGAYADFNGDGAGDFCLLSELNGRMPPRMSIFAGNPDWELGIERRTKPLKEKGFALSAYPNPFNEVTNIDFDLPSAGDLRVAVIDMTGGTVEDFQFAGLSAGLYEWTWTPAAAAAGIYLVRAEFASKGNIRNQDLKVVYLR